MGIPNQPETLLTGTEQSLWKPTGNWSCLSTKESKAQRHQMFSSEAKQKNQTHHTPKQKKKKEMNEGFLWNVRMWKYTTCQLEYTEYSTALKKVPVLRDLPSSSVESERKKTKNFHQASAQYPVFFLASSVPLRKCQNFEASPKITNYRFPLREISWGLQKTHSLGLNTHTSHTVADTVLGFIYF